MRIEWGGGRDLIVVVKVACVGDASEMAWMTVAAPFDAW